MAKLVLDNLANLQNENTAITTINDNNDAIETAMENTLSRDGTSPNQMGSNLDMNFWHILNLPEPSSDTDPVRLIDLTNVSEVTNVLHTASSTSNTIGLGTKTFTVPSGLGFFPGQYLIIQDAMNDDNYMVGRVISYSGTTLVFDSQVLSGSGTISNWTIDLSGAPGPEATVYDTVLNAIAATIPATQTFLRFSGYTTIGDGGDGLYKRQVSMPSHMGRFQSADGAWWELISRDVSPEMFGCLGNNVTDDRANFQNCIDFVNSRGGGKIVLTPNKTYRIVINTGVTNIGLDVKDDVEIWFNGSNIYLEQSDAVYGIRPRNRTRFYGPGIVRCNVSTGMASGQSIYHSVITFGAAYGDQGTVASKSPFAEISDVIIDGLTIESVAANNGGGMIVGLGGPSQIVIQNCVFPDNALSAVAIGFDWGFYGTLSSSDIAGTRVNYDAGTTYTTHPHDIIIQHNHIGNMTAPAPNGPSAGSHGVRISGCYNTKILNNVIDSSTYTSIFVTGGDLGFEFSPSAVRLNAMSGIVVEGNHCKLTKTGMGVYFDAYPDNVYDAAFNPANPSFPYVSIGVVTGYVANPSIKNNRIQTNGFTSVNPAIWFQFCQGGDIVNNDITGALALGFLQGIRIASGAINTRVTHNNITLCLNAGIYISESTLPPSNILIQHNNLSRNGGNLSTQGNIYINGSVDVKVIQNTIGQVGEDQANNGIKVDTGAAFCSIIDNLIPDVKVGGTAIALPGAITTVWEVYGNRYLGSQTFQSGLQIVPFRREYSPAVPGVLITHATAQRGALTGDTTPSFGTWGVGSTIINADAINTGEGVLNKCSVSGSPGTWKRLITSP